eukprot:Em0016g399a
MKSSIDGLTAWANVRLASKNCQAENILKDIMEGQRMKALLECITGSTSKRLDTLDGNKLPSKLKVDSKFFAMHSSDHVFPVLWTLVEHDVSLLRDLSSIYIKQPNPQLFYLTVGGESLINPLRKRVPPAQRPTAQDSLIELTHLILKEEELGSFPFIAYFLLCSYQFVQTRAVIRRLEQIEREEKDIQKMTTTGSRKKMRMKMTIMMKQRFDVVVVPRPMTINELVDSFFINLALTSQNGFYQSANKEKLWPKRRMVVRDKDTGEFYDDFSGSPSCQGSIRHMLGLSPSGVEDVKASDYAQFEVRTLQCQRLTLQAAKKGDLTTIQKLLLLEWGADLRVRNNANMAAPDLVRNDDLRSFLEEKFSEYRELTTKALARNVAFFEQYLRTHCREGGGTASLRSRSIKGNTLLHQAVIVGSMEGVKLLLSEHVPVNITNHLGATPLHLARRIDIVQHLVECGGDVNVEDDDGNTPLHCICSDQESADHALKCIPFMLLCCLGGLGVGHSGWGLGVGHSDWGLGVGHSDWGLVVGHSDWGLGAGHSGGWGLGVGHSDWGLGVGHSGWGLGVGHSGWGLGVGHSDWGLVGRGTVTGVLGAGHSDWGLGAGHSDWGLGVWHSDWGLVGWGHSDWGLGAGHSDWGLGAGHSDWGLGGRGHSDWGLGAGHSDWGLGAGHSDWGLGVWHSDWGLVVGHSDWGLGAGHSGGLGSRGVWHSDWGLGVGHSDWGLVVGHSDWGLGDWGLGAGHSDWGLGAGHSDWGLGAGHSDWGLGCGWGLGVGHSDWGLGVGHSGWGLGVGHSGWGLGVGHSDWGLGVGHSGWGLGHPNSQKQLPIHYAASCGLMAVIQSLMACDEGKGMMETLKHWQSEVMMSSLVESGFVMSGGEADDLLLMILKGPPEKCLDPIHAFQFLLKQGADPNAEYADGNRPLHLSSSLLMLPEITGLLLEAGADLNARNKQGFTPLFVACQVNNPYVANQLIVRGADYKCKDSSGMCALDYILDYEEWMDCSHFNDDMRARLKAYSLKQAKELVHSITVSLQRSEFRT